MRFNRTGDLIDANDDNYWEIEPQFAENNLNERIARGKLFFLAFNDESVRKIVKLQIATRRIVEKDLLIYFKIYRLRTTREEAFFLFRSYPSLTIVRN